MPLRILVTLLGGSGKPTTLEVSPTDSTFTLGEHVGDPGSVRLAGRLSHITPNDPALDALAESLQRRIDVPSPHTPDNLAAFKRLLGRPGVTLEIVQHEHIREDGEVVDLLKREGFQRIAGPRTVARVASAHLELVTPGSETGVSRLDFGPASNWTFENMVATRREYRQKGTYHRRVDDLSSPSGVMAYRIVVPEG